MMIKHLFITVLLSALLSTDIFNGIVIGISDGDTIIVLQEDKSEIKIRLEGIDCPEKKQAYGDKAKDATASLCFKKNVRIEKTGVDRYGRTLAFVYVGDICINKELIRQGMAWHYKKYNSDPELAKCEEEARKNKVGLWKQDNPQAPWDFRHPTK